MSCFAPPHFAEEAARWLVILRARLGFLWADGRSGASILRRIAPSAALWERSPARLGPLSPKTSSSGGALPRRVRRRVGRDRRVDEIDPVADASDDRPRAAEEIRLLRRGP